MIMSLLNISTQKDESKPVITAVSKSTTVEKVIDKISIKFDPLAWIITLKVFHGKGEVCVVGVDN